MTSEQRSEWSPESIRERRFPGKRGKKKTLQLDIREFVKMLVNMEIKSKKERAGSAYIKLQQLYEFYFEFMGSLEFWDW